MDVIKLTAIRDTPLSVDEVRLAVADPAAGGTALFAGTVRYNDHGRPVTGLSYTAHPSAVEELRKAAEKVAADFPVCGLAAVRRPGHWRPRRGGGGVLPAPGRGDRRLPGADRRDQEIGADLETPVLRGWFRGVGGHRVVFRSCPGVP